MPQTVYDCVGTTVEQKIFPDAGEEILPGIRWGLCEALFTPAYWASQWWFRRHGWDYTDYRRGVTLREEVAACLLGGHGITAEMNDAVFARLRDQGMLLSPAPSLEALTAALASPVQLGARSVRYRFPRQKAKFLHGALQRLDSEQAPVAALAFRTWLLELPGIGPKIASWITRNWLHSNDVAIIDIHVFRAGAMAALFSGRENIARDYYSLEERFLSFARALDVEARQLDAFIWRSMKDAGGYAVRQFDRWMARAG